MTFLGGMAYPVNGGALKDGVRAGVGPKLGGRWGGWPRFIVFGDMEEMEENG